MRVVLAQQGLLEGLLGKFIDTEVPGQDLVETVVRDSACVQGSACTFCHNCPPGVLA